MKELTLTGATLLDLEATSSSEVEMASAREIRASQQEVGAVAVGGVPSTQVAAALELVQQGDPNQIIQACFGIVRMGPAPVFIQLVQTWKENSGSSEVEKSLKEAKDGHGHSLLHWAAKRVDSTQFVEYLLQFIPVSVTTSSEDTMMTPLHWACTESHALPIVRMMVTSDRYAVEIADSTGCTPLLIAAQHGQVETVAYLLHHGANLHAVDASRDSATHWAAYKGSRQVLGLLSFYDTRQLTTADTYGQTPLHLASLRGHKSVCRYILSHVERKQAVQLLNQRDSNGRTPHALAVHKDKHSVATFLADYYDELTCSKSQKYTRLLQRNLRNMVSPAAWKLWLGMTVDSSDVDESPLFPYYYVCAHMLIHPIFDLWVFWSVGDASEGVLWDCVFLLASQMVLYCTGLYSFVITSSMNPGRVDSSFPHLNKWRQLYETTLEQFASSSAPVASLPQLCHTCHIARPLRSKHDRFTDSCILVFDHHCPYVHCLRYNKNSPTLMCCCLLTLLVAVDFRFVGNSIGLYNYKWFFMFLAVISLFLFQHSFLLLLWWNRQPNPSVFLLILGAFLGVHVVFPAGMFMYHAKLTSANLTTNESMNTNKYSYLWEITDGGQGNHCAGCESDHTHGNHLQSHRDPRSLSTRRFRNPFDKGCCANVMARLVYPSESSYLLDEHMESLLPAQGRVGRDCYVNDGDPHAV